MTINKLCTQGAAELAAMIRERRVTSVEVVDAYLAHIREVNPSVNAVTQTLADSARSAAIAVDRAVKAGQPLGPTNAISSTIALADIRIAQGRLHEAMSTYEQSLRLAMEQGEPVLRGTADLYVGMSELHREHNDLNAATQHLLRSKELGERTGLLQNRSRWCVAMARIREAQGDLDGALDLFHEAERLYMIDFSPNVRPVAALKTRVWVAQGRLGEALGWVREQSLSAQDELSYLLQFEHVTLARVLLARFMSDPTDHISGAIGLRVKQFYREERKVRQGKDVCSRQDAKSAKESNILFFVWPIGGASEPMFQVCLVADLFQLLLRLCVPWHQQQVGAAALVTRFIHQ